jgi:hypothetical protein
VPLVIRMATAAGRQLRRAALTFAGGVFHPCPGTARRRTGHAGGCPRDAVDGTPGTRPRDRA